MSDYERYSPANVDSFEFANFYQESHVLMEAREQLLGEADNGQRFTGIHVNRGYREHGEPTFVRLNSLFGNTATVDQQYIAYEFAAAFPDSDYMSIDLPAHGASDPLTKEQRQAIRGRDGSLKPIARSQVEAALDLNPALDDIVVSGEAAASPLAVEFATEAAKKGITVRQFFGFDPLSMEDRSPLGLAFKYLTSAQKSRNSRKEPADVEGEQLLEDAFSEDFVSLQKGYGTQAVSRAKHAGVLARERTILRLMLKKSPLTSDAGLTSLRSALESIPNFSANLVFGVQSDVGRLTDTVRYELDDIAEDSTNQLKVDVWPNDGQDLGLARHQPRLINYIKDNL